MSAEPESRMHALFEELKRRRVIRVATLYIIALWPVIQIADILSPAIGLPDAAMRLMLITFAAGLPVALMLAWLFDLNRGGIKRTDAEETRLHDKPLIGRSAELMVIVVMLCAIAVLFYLQRNDLFWDESVATTAAPPSASPPLSPAPMAAPANAKAIAVLPFVSFSEQREDQLFTDGLTEELLNVLSRVRDLQVIARTTSFAYKGVNKNVQEIGRELNVGTIIEGSVRRNDVENAIRVTAQLIDVTTGVHLWSDTFDREFRDIFKIQDEIAGAVAEQLQVTLNETARNAGVQADNVNPEAMVAFSMGRSALGRRTHDGLTDAEGHFQRAIEANPSYVTAHAQLGIVYALLADHEPASRDDYLRRAQTQIDSALTLDADSGVGWAAQGLVHMQRANKTEAKTALRKAIDMQPSLAMAHMWIGNLATDPTARRQFHARAFELDPRSPVAGYNLARDLLEEGREAESFEIFSKIVEADPHYPGAYQLLAESSEHRGRLDEALRSYTQVWEMSPSVQVATRLAALWIDIGDFAQADEWIARAEALVPPDQANEVAWLKIASYVARGDRPTAETLLAPVAERNSMHPNGHLNAALAAYFLGDFPRTVAAYEQARAFSDGAVDQLIDSAEAQIAAAFAYGELGRDEDKAKTLALAEAQITRELESRRRVPPDLWYWRALINAMRGEHAQAITHMQRAVDEGWRQHWRPQVEPSLTELAKLPVFTAMMQGLATRMDVIREQIAFDAEFDEGWNS